MKVDRRLASDYDGDDHRAVDKHKRVSKDYE